MKNAVDNDTLKKIKENVPNEWIKATESGTIERLIEAISKRRDTGSIPCFLGTGETKC